MLTKTGEIKCGAYLHQAQPNQVMELPNLSLRVYLTQSHIIFSLP